MFASGISGWTWIRTALSIVVVTMAVYACQDGRDADSPVELDQQLTQVEDVHFDPTELRSTDRVFAAIAEQAPNFAGMYYENESPAFDAQGRLVIMVADSEGEAAAIDAVRSYGDGHYLTNRFAGQRPIRVEKVDYSFLQLARWREAAVTVVGGDAIQGLDIRERENRLEINLHSVDLESEIREDLTDAGVPAAAVATLPPVQDGFDSHDLDDRVRPVRGGLAINQPASNNLGGCTHGFVAELSDGTDGFFTASHCTYTTFDADPPGSPFYQDTINDISAEIGLEYEDVTVTSCSEDADGCVESDAAFISYDYLSSSEYGYTVARMDQNGTAIDHNNPHWDVEHDWVDCDSSCDPISGQYMWKTGHNTNRTSGKIDRTCKDIEPDDQEVTILCEYRVSTTADSIGVTGDSGSPVYEYIGQTGTIRIYGQYWGGTDDDTGGDWFWFSDQPGMVDDFGSMTTY